MTWGYNYQNMLAYAFSNPPRGFVFGLDRGNCNWDVKAFVLEASGEAEKEGSRSQKEPLGQGSGLCGERVCLHAKSLQLCLTLCDPMDHGQPGSSVHGILQTRKLQWVAMSTSRGSSQPRDLPVLV